MEYKFSKKFICCVVFIVININIAICQEMPSTPCPNLFTYRSDGNEVFGFINVNSPPVGQSLFLSVVFSVRGPLYSTNPGSLDLAVTKEQAYQRIIHNKPLQFKIKFPAGIPIPVLNEMYYNNETICAGNPVEADLVTTFKLHTHITPSSLTL